MRYQNGVVAFKLRKRMYNDLLRCLMFLPMLWGVVAAQSVIDSEMEPAKTAELISGGVTVSSVAGGPADLPCDISLSSKTDAVILVVWYNNDKPIYSWDTRRGERSGEETGSHWSGLSGPSSRARWSTATASLTFRPALPEDRGDYQCRADFLSSPTRITRVHLQVIEAAGTPVVTDDRGREIRGKAGPYREGDTPQLTCTVTGGYPPASVRWYRGGRAVPGSGPGEGVLRLQPLRRDDLLAPLSCQATNSPLLPPTTATLLIDMQLAPLNVEIMDRDALSAGRVQELTCKSIGGKPPPAIEWWLSGEQLDATQQDIEIESNEDRDDKSSMNDESKAFREDGSASTSTSVLRLTARAQQHSQLLTCRVLHSLLPAPLESQLTLNVLFAPSVSLSLGANLNPNDIEEGDDVYFECKVTANPPPYKLIWEHNGRALAHEPKAGVMASGDNLVLRNVPRTAAGSYSCSASNVEGDARSPPVLLQVMYKPVCIATLRRSYGVARQEKARLLCEVESVPPPDSFSWALNNSANQLEVAADRFTWTSSPARSTLVYAPISEMDYGTALCWASNLVGRQVEPCALTLLPASRPFAPTNCSLTNQTVAALEIICDSGYDGGLPQWFQLEVMERPLEQLLANVTSRKPSFLVGGLAPGRALRLAIYAANSRGRSEVVYLDAFTLELAEKRTGNENVIEITSVLGMVAGAIGGILLLVIVAFIAIKLRRRSTTDYTVGCSKQKQEGISSNSRARPPPAHLFTHTLSDDKNPDVVPLNKSTELKVSLKESDVVKETAKESSEEVRERERERGGPPRPPPYSRAPPPLANTFPVDRGIREVVTTRALLPAAQESDV